MSMLLSVVAQSRRRGFDPLSLSPALWLADSGANPDLWPDLSGHGRDAVAQGTQPAVISNGLNGKQVRDFSGVRGFLFPRPLSLASIFVVQRPQGHAWGIFGTSNGPVGWIGNDGATGVVAFNCGTPSFRLNGAPVGWTNRGQVHTDTNNSWNLVAAENFNFNAHPDLVGLADRSGFFYSGQIAEILIYAPLAPADTEIVENYLAVKWGIGIA